MSASVDFDNGTDRLEASDSSGLDITGNLTVFAWFRRDAAASQNEGIIAKFQSQTGSTNQRSYALVNTGSNHYIRLVVSSDGTSGTNQNATSSTANPLNTWAFGAGIFIPSTSIKVYRGTSPDAVAEVGSNTTSINSAIHSGSAPLWVGHQFDSTNANLGFAGQVAMAGVIADAATLDELKLLAYGIDPISLFGSNVKAYYKLFGTDTVSLKDLSGNSHNLTNNGAADSTEGPPVSQRTYPLYSSSSIVPRQFVVYMRR